MQMQLLLALVVKAMNGTLGTEGIITSSLVYREFSSIRSMKNLSYHVLPWRKER